MTTSTTVRPRGALSLRVNIGWTMVGNVIYAACQWGMLIAIARYGNAEMVGQFALGLAIVAPIFMLADLQMRSLYVTDADSIHPVSDYIAVRLLTNLLAISTTIAIAASIGWGDQKFAVVVCLGFAKVFQSLSDFCHAIQQRREHMSLVSQSLIIRGLLSLALLLIGMAFTEDVVIGLIGTVVANFLVLLCFDIPQAGRFEIDSQNHLVSVRNSFVNYRQQLLPLLKHGLTLGATMFLISLGNQVPRYVVASAMSESQLGIFAAISYFLVAGSTVVTALGASASPRLAKYYAAGNNVEFRKLGHRMLSFVCGLSIAGVLLSMSVGRYLLEVVYGAQYAQYHWLLTAIVGCSILAFSANILGYLATAARSFAMQPLVVASSALMALGSCTVLVPVWGLYGAVVGAAIGQAVMFIGYGGICAAACRRLLTTDSTGFTDSKTTALVQ